MRPSISAISAPRCSTSKVPPQTLERGPGLFDTLAEIGDGQHPDQVSWTSQRPRTGGAGA
jgi:hypothetical protein